MTHVSTKMKRILEVAIYENKRARGRHKGKGYTIATILMDKISNFLKFFVNSACRPVVLIYQM